MINELRDTLKMMDGDPELVLQVLLEQGWITEQGVIALDLVEILPDAVEAAFEDPIGD
jgi:hypothetical protein